MEWFKDKKEALYKDELLLQISMPTFTYLNLYCTENNLDWKKAFRVSYGLKEMGFIVGEDGKYKVTERGYYFLFEEGGFIKSYKSQRHKQIWNIAKTITIIANAIIIIFIAAIGVYYQVKFNNLENEKKIDKQTIEQLQKKVDLLEKRKK